MMYVVIYASEEVFMLINCCSSPPAIRAVQKASPASSERKQFACIAIALGFAAQAMLLLSGPTSVVRTSKSGSYI